MRIKAVIVKNLFGTFNHEIPLNLDEKVTIIHGPNGFGKTFILTMLSKFFREKFEYFLDIPFNEFLIVFDDGRSISIKKMHIIMGSKHSEINNESVRLSIELIADGKVIHDYQFSRSNFLFLDSNAMFYSRFKKIDDNLWRDKLTDETTTSEAILETYGKRIAEKTPIENEKPLWLKNILSSQNVHFIETQRLVRFKKFPSKNSRITQDNEPEPAVELYAKELSRRIERKFAEYGSLSQSLDRTFPERLLERDPTSSLTVDELKKQLTLLEEKRIRLEKTGLWDEKEKINLRALFEKINESNTFIMSAYIEDSNDKLKTFDSLHIKINLLRKFINGRFKYKKMLISKSKGFSFVTTNTGISEVIFPKFLSSGEQHEVVLFYELLFKVHSKSLILIDEPELSLHVTWQEQFLNDLMEITKIRDFDVLIATHSPDIISDKWNLTVELKGPIDEQKK